MYERAPHSGAFFKSASKEASIFEYRTDFKLHNVNPVGLTSQTKWHMFIFPQQNRTLTNKCNLEKGKPRVSGGRKATGPPEDSMREDGRATKRDYT